MKIDIRSQGVVVSDDLREHIEQNGHRWPPTNFFESTLILYVMKYARDVPIKIFNQKNNLKF